MIQYCDIHSHNQREDCKVILSVSPTEFEPYNNSYYSVGIHPWDSNDITSHHIITLQQTVTHKQVVAIGETGIDRLRGASTKIQTQLLERHIHLSEEYHKPLILHVVRAVDIILSLYKSYKPTQQWIIHGYRGNSTTALQLLEKGINLSYNHTFNEESVLITPLDSLWIESDNHTQGVEEIYINIARIKNIDTDTLKNSIYRRAEKLFFQA